LHHAPILGELSKPAAYEELLSQAVSLFAHERSALANCANLAALIYQSLADLNWAGFYLLQEGELVLGPFQGKVACVRIALGKGVCGTAAARRETVIVPDVHEFPGHIACDAASRSEIVIPMLKSGRLLGVFDIDSPQLGRFDRDDAAGLARLLDGLLEHSDFTRLVD
jgi:GAF domain-containing protein